VQFHRKQTFDAGATPGLDDFERPDLKSVSEDLVSELAEISEEKAQTEDRIDELREQLDEKNSRIAELEAELQDARDLQRMADQFTQALVDHVRGPNPGRTEQERMRERRAAGREDAQASFDDGWADGTAGEADTAGGADDPEEPLPDEAAREDDGYEAAAMTWADDDPPADGAAAAAGGVDDGADDSDGGNPDGWSAVVGAADGEAGADGPDATDGDDAAVASETDGGRAVDAEPTRGFESIEDNPLGDKAANAFERGTSTAVDGDAVDDAEALADRLADDLAALSPETRQMLRYYREQGPGTPTDALFAAGGDDDRTTAYARNRRLRVRGLVEHVGRGRYEYRLPALLRERTGRQDVADLVDTVERSLDSDDAGASSEAAAAGGAD
jgi:hypothetical protein